jgi:hypothetical protein
MSDSCCSEKSRAVAAWAVGGIGSMLIIGALTWYVARDNSAAVDAARGRTRLETRTRLDAAAKTDLEKFAIDPNKENLAQLGISRAMEVLVAEWKDGSEAGRAKLIERLENSKKVPSFE